MLNRTIWEAFQSVRHIHCPTTTHMRFRLLWDDLKGSLWFVPGAMLLGAGLLGAGMVELSSRTNNEILLRYPRIFGAGAESSRDMLSTIASAMMTVASVTFSITILAVAQASSQYTPRILRNFMRDTANQVTLGTLTGVFVYCLVVVRTVRGAEELLFVPALAVLLAFVLAVVAIGVLIYFIHHIALSLEAAQILDNIRHDTVAAIERVMNRDDNPAEEAAHARADHVSHRWFPVESRRTGYISRADGEGLLKWAANERLILKMDHAIGDHVVRDSPLLSVSKVIADQQKRALQTMFSIGPVRSVRQDPLFGFSQMVDIAVKALSPGVNDTSTATAAIDAISAAMLCMLTYKFPPATCYDGDELRLIRATFTFESVLGVAIDDIRRNADGNVRVLNRLLGMLELINAAIQAPEQMRTVRSHADRILAVAERTVNDQVDLELLREHYRQVVQATPLLLPAATTAQDNI